MFGMGETDEYPAWAIPLLVRRMLWKDYGVGFEDMEFQDIMLAMALKTLEDTREKYLREKMLK